MRKLLILSLILVFKMGLAQESNDSIKEKKSDKTFSNSITPFNITTGSFSLGEENGASFTTINGIEFKNRLGIGLGMGLERIDYDGYLSLFLDSRYHFFQHKNSPFVNLTGGVLLPNREYNYEFMDYKHFGMNSSLSVGTNLFITKHIAINTSIGYKFSYVQSPKVYWWGWEEPLLNAKTDQMDLLFLNSLEVKIGFLFK